MTPPRPKLFDAEVEARHVKLIEPSIKKLLAESSHSPEDDLDSVVKDVARAMRYASDGYQVGKRLEECGWDVDASLVATLDSLVSQRSEALAHLESQWVRENGVTVPFSIGNAVRIVSKDSSKSHGQVGEVTKVYPKHARVLVRVEALGHVREGNGTHGLVLNVEDVETVS
jgi:hypothetical protein